MKALRLHPISPLSLVFLCLALHIFVFAQSPSRTYSAESVRKITGSQSISGIQLDLINSKSLYTYNKDSYIDQEILKIKEAIGNSQWWDDLPGEAQKEILQKVQVLPDEPSLENLKEILSISWKGQLIKKRTKSGMSDCSQGDVFLSSQDEVNDFGSMGCTQVTGHLIIDDSQSDQKITDLSPLSSLQKVDSVLQITTSQLTTLDGLSNLSSVGYLRVLTNTALTSLEGLTGLTIFTGPVKGCGCSYLITNNFISFNPLIEDLSGLDSLTTVFSGFYISENNKLKNLKGLEKYTYSAAGLDIAHHSSLTSFEGLSGLQTVQGNLVIRLNSSLKSFTGLDNLTTIGHEMIIERNQALVDLTGLDSLTTVKNRMFINDNPSMINLDGLNALLSVGKAEIINNFSLKNISALSGITSINSDFLLFNNPALENIDGLSGLTTLKGWLLLQDLHSLENIDGLANLTSAVEFTIAFCHSLKNLDGLSNLSQVDGVTAIVSNEQLENLDGLSNLTNIDGDFILRDNPVLSSCCGIFQLLCSNPPGCQSHGIHGAIQIANNNTGCTASEITAGGPCMLTAVNTVDPMQSKPDLSVYPNPAQGVMIIGLESFHTGSAQVKIKNSLGQTLWQKQIEDVHEVNQLTVNLRGNTSFEPGLYFVSIFREGDVQTRQVMIQR